MSEWLKSLLQTLDGALLAVADHAALVASIAVSALLVIATGLFAVFVDRRIRQLSARRFEKFVNVSMDGIVIVEDNRIRSVNESFLKLVQCEGRDVIGTTLVGRILHIPDSAPETGQPWTAEGVLDAGQSAHIPVSVIASPVPLERRDVQVFTLRDLRERRRAESQIRFLTEHDALTGLPNRTLLRSKLSRVVAQAMDANSLLGIFLIDLDRFKDVNDIFGQAAGDLILRAVTTRLRDLGDDATLHARLGGDDFVLIQTDLPSVAAADALAEKITAALSQPYDHDGKKIALAARVGVALYPHDGGTPDALLARADTALRRAKASSEHRYCFFETALDEEARERRAIGFDLRAAIELDQLALQFQPIAALPGLDVTGFEALLRWRHPTRGLVSPAIFIPIAEETLFIAQLGEWALRAACAEAATWPNPLTVAVNLSPIQLQQINFPEVVQDILYTTGLPARRLELEVTETALIKDFQRSLDVLRRLKALGIRIAMDDFGTGYSSLSTLQAFPFDKIKIDKSFVDRLDSHGQAESIVKAVLGLGKSLRIPIVAEGVETEQQYAFLAEASCDFLQGYLVGRPQPIAHYERLTHANEPVAVRSARADYPVAQA